MSAHFALPRRTACCGAALLVLIGAEDSLERVLKTGAQASLMTSQVFVHFGTRRSRCSEGGARFVNSEYRVMETASELANYLPSALGKGPCSSLQQEDDDSNEHVKNKRSRIVQDPRRLHM